MSKTHKIVVLSNGKSWIYMDSLEKAQVMVVTNEDLNTLLDALVDESRGMPTIHPISQTPLMLPTGSGEIHDAPFVGDCDHTKRIHG